MPSVVQEPNVQGRLLLVSNRLPITIKRSDDGSYSFSMSSGGLVTGLSGLSKSTTFQWYGWPGLEVPDAEAGPMVKRLKDEHGAVPVFIDDELADQHYNGFSSKQAARLNTASANSIRRLYPLASIPLPPRRDHIRRVGMGGIQGSQQTLRKDRGKGCTRRRFDLGSRLPFDASTRDATRGDWIEQEERQDWLLPAHAFP